MARPSKIDDTILLPDGKGGSSPRIRWEVIVERVRAGSYAEVAAASTGIGRTTYYRWLELGEDRWVDGELVRARPQYRGFRDAIDRAAAEAEMIAVAHVQRAAADDWRAAMTYLERRAPERWRRRDTVYQAGPGPGDPKLPAARVIHDLDSGAAGKLAELVELVSRASSAPDSEGSDGGTP